MLRETDIQLRSCLPDSEALIARRLGSIFCGLYGCREYVRNHYDAVTQPRLAIAPELDWPRTVGAIATARS